MMYTLALCTHSFNICHGCRLVLPWYLHPLHTT